jgi:glycosyltransferase involved in cell wall biosynthesis
MNLKGRSIVLVGSALPADEAAAHRDVSAAAARWQMDFASALREDFGARVRCLSFLPLASGEKAPVRDFSRDDFQVIPVIWRRGVFGIGAYMAAMVGQILSTRSDCALVFCYNPSPWTAPWAMLLSILSRAPMIMIVADIAPSTGSPRQQLLARVERILLDSASRFLVLSDATRALLPKRTLSEVFAGVGDEKAVAAPLPTQSDRVKFVYTGSLAEYGGVQVFLSAAERIPVSRGCEFHIFGKGTVTIPPALKDRVQMHGFVSDSELNDFMGSDCVGINPRIDATRINRYNAPYKLLYYLSRGVPTITTLTPGVGNELSAACIVTEDTPESLAAAMNAVLRMTPDERVELGAKGRAAILLNHNREALKQKLEALIPQVCR